MRYYGRRSGIKTFFYILDIIRRVFLGIIFWGIIIGVIVAISGGRAQKIKENTVLVLHPSGQIVDSYTYPAALRGEPGTYLDEMLLDDLITALDIAAGDNRIKALWIQLEDFTGAGPAVLSELSGKIAEFRDRGKIVVASSDSYDNSSYRIASEADFITVDRLGEVFPVGYSSLRAYFSKGLEKLGADVQLFRSGESKSAAENFIRQNMSDTARADTLRLLDDLWNNWLVNTAVNRDMKKEDLSDWINNYDKFLEKTGGNSAASALNAGLVDAVDTGNAAESFLKQHFGEDYFTAGIYDYLHRTYHKKYGGSVIAVVPVNGELVYGEGSGGKIGSSEIIDALETAENTPGVKAFVLRINSPGGDVRSGEAVRRKIEDIRKKYPVVVSMGNLAASGGYWIACESDYIYTQPETITGSIGVYSLSVTFEKALDKWLGISIDGVGTTPWSAVFNPGVTLDERSASIYRQSIKDIDTMFKKLVAEKRDLDISAVEKLAGGIPWSGRRAVDLGLADSFGNLNDACVKAAELAVADLWTKEFFERKVDPREELISKVIYGNSGFSNLIKVLR